MERVGFEVFLQDNFSKGFEHLGEGLKEQVSEISGMLMELFALREAVEFGKEAMEYAGHIQEAQAQIQASLESTGNAARVSTGELNDWAKELDEHSKFAKDQIESAQSVLLTFTKLTGDVQEQALQASADIATKMHMDIQQASVQVGKALQDPIRGIMALRREGVNFSKDQQNVIKHLVDTGQAAKAQQMIIRELNTEFAGSAQAAIDANPMLQLEKAIDELKESVGSFLNEGLKKLIPYIREWIEDAKELGHWLKEHKGLIELVVGTMITYLVVSKAVAAGEWLLGSAMAARAVVMTLAEAYQMALAEGMGILEAAQWALNIAMDANPIGLIIIGITALIVGIYEAYTHFESFRRVIDTAWVAIKAYGEVLWDSMILPLTTAYHAAAALYDVLTGDFSGAKSHMQAVGDNVLQMINDIKSGIKDVQGAWGKDYTKPYEASDDEVAGEKAIWDKQHRGAKGSAGASGADGEGKNTTTVTGSRSTVVNIDIKTLAEFHNTFNSANEKDTKKMFNQLMEAALGAANDFNIIGGEGI